MALKPFTGQMDSQQQVTPKLKPFTGKLDSAPAPGAPPAMARPAAPAQRDPFSYSPAETASMKADFMAREGQNIFGGKQAGTPQQVMGIASQQGQQSADQAKQLIPSPTGRQLGQGIESFAIGAGAGIEKTVKGAQQLISTAASHLPIPGADEAGKRAEQRSAERHQIDTDIAPLLKDSTSAKVGQFIGEAAPMAVIPGGIAGGFLKRAVTAAAAGGIQGAIMDADHPGTGAATGAALGAAGSGIMSGIGKMAEGVGLKVNPRIATESEKYNVPVSIGEATGGRHLQVAETLNEKVPFSGMSSFRETQHEAAKNAATKQFSEYVVDPSLDSTAAMKIANDEHLDGLYQTVKNNAAGLPSATAPNVKSAASDLIDRYSSVFESIQDGHIKKILSNIKGDTADRTISLGQGSSMKSEPKFSFDDLWTLRKGVGREIGDAKTNTARGQLNALYSAVSDDIDSMLSNGGGKAVKDFKAANDAFKKYSVKFDVMREAYDKAMGTTSASEMFSPKKYSTALKRLAEDPKYKKNVKWSNDEIENMTGLANILQVVKRAGQFKENLPTGNRVADAMGLAVIAKAPLTIPAGWATTFLTTTKVGKSLLSRSAKVSPTGYTMKRVLSELNMHYGELVRTGTVEAGMPDNAPAE